MTAETYFGAAREADGNGTAQPSPYSSHRPRIVATAPADGDGPDCRDPGDRDRRVVDPGPKAEPKRYILRPASELWAPLPPLRYVAEPVIPRATIAEIVAYGASGKTWLSVDLACAVAAGRPWLGRWACPVGRVAILDWENGDRELRRRLMAVSPDALEGVDACTLPTIAMTDAAFGAAILGVATGRDLVIVDTFRAATGGADENDSGIRVPLDVLRRVADATGCAFAVLLHARKNGPAGGGQSDPREAGRGSSALFDAADVVLHVSAEDGLLTLRQTKSRLGRAVEPVTVEIRDTADGRVEVVATDAIAAEQDRAQRATDELTDAVLAVVRANPGASTQTVCELSRKRHGRVAAALDMLTRGGAVRNMSSTRRSASWVAVEAQSDGGEPA